METIHFARELRNNMTDAEKKLWHHLKQRQIYGHKFRRQHPVGNYIADFVCLEKGLIIELDGGQHNENINADKIRTEFLNKQGFKVLRFWNNEVLKNIDGVKQVIAEELLNHPHPNLPPGRGKE